MYAEDFAVDASADEQYFDSYGTDIKVHRIMLDDKPRMDFYRMCLSRPEIRDAVVIDVGAGSGILSMFALKGGAARVVAVEASPLARLLAPTVARNAARIAAALGVPAATVQGRFTVFHGVAEAFKVSDALLVEMRAAPRVFVVSEWMGFYLFHEGMLPSVLAVRDTITTALGAAPTMIPDSASLQVAPVREGFALAAVAEPWQDVDGFDMGELGAVEAQQAMSRNPVVLVVPASSVVAAPSRAAFDLQRITFNELRQVELASSFIMPSGVNFEGFAIWFTVEYEGAILDTAPHVAPTHWKQTVLALPEPTDFEGDTVGVRIFMSVEDQSDRCYELAMELFDPNDS
jgi:predicted RNA methylase